MALIDAYLLPLTSQQVAHLLRRTTFGGTPTQLKELTGQTATVVIQKLLTTQPAPPHPTDPQGKTFHELAWGFPASDNQTQNSTDGTRRALLKWWWTGQFISQGLSTVEKMTLFWQNHFVSTSQAVSDVRFLYRQNQLLRHGDYQRPCHADLSQWQPKCGR
jgi:uncharacterized protein (DUF1800 family)